MSELQSTQPTTLGGRIVSAREGIGLTTAQLARRMGVKTATLSSWETDRSEPRANRIATLAAMSNVSLIWLLSADGEGPAAQTLSGDLSQLKSRLSLLQSQAEDMTAQIAALIEHIDQLNDGSDRDE